LQGKVKDRRFEHGGAKHVSCPGRHLTSLRPYAEHLLCADESLRFFLSELFNMCIFNGYIPDSCLNTTIVPICKNKNGNMSDNSNYRPVAVATVVSKLLEHFILSNISAILGTTDNQFGFKAGHSTDQCTFLLKQTASYFVTMVHLCMLCF